MEILFLTYDLSDSCSFYRSAGIIKDLQKKIDHNITAIKWGDVALNWSFITRFDLIYLQRPFSKEALNLCNYVKLCNIPIWVDWDDNLFDVNPENPTYYLYNNPETKENIKGILKLADAVSVPTEYLRQTYSAFNSNIFVIPNAFNDSLFKRPDLPKRTNQIIWRGPQAHIYDLMTYGNEINKCTKEFPAWQFVFMGFSPWFLNETGNKEFIPMQDVVLYYKNLFDIAPACLHVPLHDNIFNRCKSNIAALEASYAGAVCVTPAWWNMPGTVPYTDQASYYEAIRSVLSGEVDKVVLNMEAWEYIMDVLPLSKINVERLQVINSLI